MFNISTILSNIPTGLKKPLLESYQSIVTNYIEHRWEPSELNGGKFCEVVYSVVNGHLLGSFPPKPSKPKDMVAACRVLESVPPDSRRIGDRSVRILIPRMLPVLYEIRNNRGVGHVGGDVDPNFLDASTVYEMASWLLAELIRIFHGISISEAQNIVNTLVERKLPLIWEITELDIKRVLNPQMGKGDQSLLLLYTQPSWVSSKQLYRWIEYSSYNMFQNRILRPFHKSRLIENDEAQSRVRISPLGSNEVEKRILKTV